MAPTLNTHRLTAQDVEHYDRDGYVLYKKPVFSPAKFAKLKAIFEENLANAERTTWTLFTSSIPVSSSS